MHSPNLKYHQNIDKSVYATTGTLSKVCTHFKFLSLSYVFGFVQTVKVALGLVLVLDDAKPSAGPI